MLHYMLSLNLALNIIYGFGRYILATLNSIHCAVNGFGR